MAGTPNGGGVDPRFQGPLLDPSVSVRTDASGSRRLGFAKRSLWGYHFSTRLESYDLLLTPTLPLAAFDAGGEAPGSAKRWVNWTPFTFPFNLTQQPVASVPCGLTRAGLPVGLLHIVGAKYADARVLRAARAFERAHPIAMPDLSSLVK